MITTLWIGKNKQKGEQRVLRLGRVERQKITWIREGVGSSKGDVESIQQQLQSRVTEELDGLLSADEYSL